MVAAWPAETTWVLLSGGSATFPTPQLTGPRDVPPTRPSLVFLDKCVTGAVRTSPVTAASCSSTGGGVPDGTRVGQFRNPLKTPLGVSETLDWRDLRPSLRALGLQLPETAAVWSKSASIKEKQQRRIWNFTHETCVGSFQNARRRVCVHGREFGMPASFSVAPWML